MLRIILGVVAGFIAWSIIWVGSDQVLMALSPGWYGNHQYGLQAAMVNQTSFTPDNTILFLHLVRAAIISIVAGFLAAVIARESRRAPLILGILLLLFGIAVQVLSWQYLPVWYHLIFLGMLIPFTVLGGRLRRST